MINKPNREDIDRAKKRMKGLSRRELERGLRIHDGSAYPQYHAATELLNDIEEKERDLQTSRHDISVGIGQSAVKWAWRSWAVSVVAVIIAILALFIGK